MKNFLLISNFLPSVLNFRGKLLEAIQKEGYIIHIIAPNLSEFSDEAIKIKELGYHLHEVPMQRTGKNPLFDLKTLFFLYKLIVAIKPDYMLSYTIKPVIYGTLAGWLANVPRRFALIPGLGYAFQNSETNDARSIFQVMVHGLYKYALSHAHKIFFQNPDDKELLQKLKLIQVPAVVVNGSGVDIEAFDVVALPQDNNKKIKVSFLMIARLLSDKGVREYADAAKIIKIKHPEVEFNLVGWIDENPAAISQQELDTWIESGIVVYWGKMSDVRPAIAATSVYVLPSYREGTPRTVLEAMAMGRAIITTDAPGCRETVINNVNGYLIEVKSTDSLVQAMKKFIDEPQKAATMGSASRAIALEKYDVNIINQYMIAEMGL